MKVAFLDRDGTIIKDYPDEKWKYISIPEFIEGAINALKEIQKKGYQIVIITNQYLIGEQIITSLQYEDFTRKFVEVLKSNDIGVLDIFYCPHARSEKCDCSKPSAGMILKALEKYPDIDLHHSFIVGDSVCDVLLGDKVGIMTFGIGLDVDNCKYTRIESLKAIGSYL